MDVLLNARSGNWHEIYSKKSLKTIIPETKKKKININLTNIFITFKNQIIFYVFILISKYLNESHTYSTNKSSKYYLDGDEFDDASQDDSRAVLGKLSRSPPKQMLTQPTPAPRSIAPGRPCWPVLPIAAHTPALFVTLFSYYSPSPTLNQQSFPVIFNNVYLFTLRI